jgi:hypothetical protein
VDVVFVYGVEPRVLKLALGGKPSTRVVPKVSNFHRAK